MHCRQCCRPAGNPDLDGAAGALAERATANLAGSGGDAGFLEWSSLDLRLAVSLVRALGDLASQERQLSREAKVQQTRMARW